MYNTLYAPFVVHVLLPRFKCSRLYQFYILYSHIRSKLQSTVIFSIKVYLYYVNYLLDHVTAKNFTLYPGDITRVFDDRTMRIMYIII